MFISVFAVQSVHQIKLSHFFSAEQSEVIFFTLVVDSIEVGQGGIVAGHLAITQEPPNLSESQAETLLGLGGFNFTGVETIP